jgi:hypothetical protein
VALQGQKQPYLLIRVPLILGATLENLKALRSLLGLGMGKGSPDRVCAFLPDMKQSKSLVWTSAVDLEGFVGGMLVVLGIVHAIPFRENESVLVRQSSVNVEDERVAVLLLLLVLVRRHPPDRRDCALKGRGRDRAASAIGQVARRLEQFREFLGSLAGGLVKSASRPIARSPNP